jgi:hypothetical protein
MTEDQFFQFDSNGLNDEAKRKILTSTYIAYVQSCQNLTRSDSIHNTELRSLLTFLLVLVVSLTIGIKLESACLTWVGIQFIFTILSKFSQFYNRLEVERTKKNVEDIIKSLNVNDK